MNVKLYSGTWATSYCDVSRESTVQSCQTDSSHSQHGASLSEPTCIDPTRAKCNGYRSHS
jgi:hypothetical protein